MPEVQIRTRPEEITDPKSLVVVIDVFRAFSHACYLAASGASLTLVDSLEEAKLLKKHHPKYLLAGEENGVKPSDFDFGNSPSEIQNTKLRGKTVVQRTSSGTRGVIAAMHAKTVITGGFVNASAIIKYIRSKSPSRVYLFATNQSLEENEDVFLATYLKQCLEEKESHFDMSAVRNHRCSAHFFNDPNFPPEDLDLCLDIDRFNFVLKAEKKN